MVEEGRGRTREKQIDVVEALNYIIRRFVTKMNLNSTMQEHHPQNFLGCEILLS
jgi:poly(A) polymerase Pap1